MQEKINVTRLPSVSSPRVAPRGAASSKEELWRTSKTLVMRYGPDGNLTYVNDAYCSYHMQDRDNVLGKNFIHRVPMDDLLRISRAVTRLSPFSPERTVHHDVIMPDGRIRNHLWLHRALFHPDGSMFEYVAAGMDVSDLQDDASLGLVEHRLKQHLDALCGRDPQVV